jgi:hypothetical protein
MDLYKLIQDLNAEKERLDRVIASFEELQRAEGLSVVEASGRGNRRRLASMGPKEGQDVSARMTKYWASRCKSG